MIPPTVPRSPFRRHGDAVDAVRFSGDCTHAAKGRAYLEAGEVRFPFAGDPLDDRRVVADDLRARWRGRRLRLSDREGHLACSFWIRLRQQGEPQEPQCDLVHDSHRTARPRCLTPNMVDHGRSRLPECLLPLKLLQLNGFHVDRKDSLEVRAVAGAFPLGFTKAAVSRVARRLSSREPPGVTCKSGQRRTSLASALAM